MAQTLVDRTCRRCGRGFQITLRRFNQQRRLYGDNGAVFCSRACFNDPDKYESRDCATCGGPFRVLKTAIGKARYPGLYCSRACIPAPGRKLTKVCPACGRSFSYYPSEKPGLTCGRKCPARQVDASKGRLQTSAWKQRRAEAIARDNGQCQRCGVTPRRPDVHHIIAWEISRDDSLENLVTLCKSCHRTVENLARYAHV